MRRREFVALVGSAVAAWPLAADAQQVSKPPTIGFAGSGTPLTQGQMATAFSHRLGELGWIESRTVAIENRWAEGSNERASEIAAEFVKLKVDVIVPIGTPLAIAAKHATSIIPIVFAVVGDPVGAGLISNLPRPGGNITGLSNQAPDTASKRLGLLHDLVPKLRHLAIMANVGNPLIVRELEEVQSAAATLGLTVETSEIRATEDIAPAFVTLKDHVDALYVCTDGLTISNRVRINTMALAARLPTVHSNPSQLEGGGLISYGPNFKDMIQRAAEIVDKVLHGTKPGDIPVEEPTKFELVINLKAAKALGLVVPYSMQLLADEVIE
jgi:putative tryptophan/tyrosine transport system substrate-binding protein